METTKTGLLQRIALPGEVMDILRWHDQRLDTGPAELRDSELLFPSETGGFRAASCLDRPFREITEAIGLKKHITARAMRRTFNDLCRRAEVRDVVTRSISGHLTEEMQRHYSTVAPDEQREPVAEMWQQPNSNGKHSSAHFVIGQDGTVIQAVRLKDVAWHAHAVNSISVGIEHCARSPHEWSDTDPGLPLSDAQYLASARLVAWLLSRAGMQASRDTIRGHAEADPQMTHADCPGGCGWDWPRFIGMVQREMEVVT